MDHACCSFTSRRVACACQGSKYESDAILDSPPPVLDELDRVVPVRACGFVLPPTLSLNCFESLARVRGPHTYPGSGLHHAGQEDPANLALSSARHKLYACWRNDHFGRRVGFRFRASGFRNADSSILRRWLLTSCATRLLENCLPVGITYP